MVRGETVDVWLEWTETPGYRLSVSNVVLFQGSYAYPDDELMSVFREEDRRNLTANNRQYVYVWSVGHLCDRLDVYWGASVLKGRVAGSQSVAAALKTLCIVRKTPVCRAQGFRPPLCQQSARKTDTERAGRVIHRHWGRRCSSTICRAGQTLSVWPNGSLRSRPRSTIWMPNSTCP